MLTPKMKRLISRAVFKYDYKMRAIGMYYRSNAKLHPDPSMAEHCVIEADNPAGAKSCAEYIRLSNSDGLMAVYRVFESGRMRRLKRWPSSVQNGNASTFDQLMSWGGDIMGSDYECFLKGRICANAH